MLNADDNIVFADLLGQERAKNLLRRTLSSGRIAHAYLFRGPAGVGKTLFAKVTAMALNCRELGPGNACGSCFSCNKYLSGNHPDFVIEKPEKGTIKIDRVRDLCKSLNYAPYESAKRVVVVEDVHTMRAEAANCLLKTLEEPPDDNVIILTTETAKNLLPTISSRCQIIPFYPLSESETVEILSGPEYGLDTEVSKLLARLSEGSPGQALLLHKRDMIEAWKIVTKVLSFERYKEDRHVGTVLQTAQQMADLKDDLVPMLGLLRVWLKDLMMKAAESFERDNGVEKENSQKRELELLFAKMQAINEAEQQLARNCNRSLVCEILLFRLQ